MRAYEEHLRAALSVGPEEPPEAAAKRWARNKALAIALDGVNEAIRDRFNALCIERRLTMGDLVEGDWMQEFVEKDETMATLHDVRKMLYEERLEG